MPTKNKFFLSLFWSYFFFLFVHLHQSSKTTSYFKSQETVEIKFFSFFARFLAIYLLVYKRIRIRFSKNNYGFGSGGPKTLGFGTPFYFFLIFMADSMSIIILQTVKVLHCFRHIILWTRSVLELRAARMPARGTAVDHSTVEIQSKESLHSPLLFLVGIGTPCCGPEC
jgi:hypothetical protein